MLVRILEWLKKFLTPSTPRCPCSTLDPRDVCMQLFFGEYDRLRLTPETMVDYTRGIALAHVVRWASGTNVPAYQQVALVDARRKLIDHVQAVLLEDIGHILKRVGMAEITKDFSHIVQEADFLVALREIQKISGNLACPTTRN